MIGSRGLVARKIHSPFAVAVAEGRNRAQITTERQSKASNSRNDNCRGRNFTSRESWALVPAFRQTWRIEGKLPAQTMVLSRTF